ncbi:MAG TPA: L-seryl-tRNA(Sec) selenium transferase [Blastocatellia bacterium]|nr:L-seryl-tRNA(Sec) selenium transferase [Blastocatellia bacterium]
MLRSLPSIDRMLASAAALRLAGKLGRDRVRDILREITGELRIEIAAGNLERSFADGDTSAALMAEVERRLEAQSLAAVTPSVVRVVNATGVVVHTNLGRAPLARAAADALLETATHYSNLEYDLQQGGRGRREVHCQQLLARLTSAESAIVANNNAAAVLLVLNTLAEGGEVIVSRGELIEIGGSFRIPDVMEKSGARLCEVGTTNRTHIADYANAINEQTRLILRVHPSNYRIVGFTSRPDVREIGELAKRAGIASYEDLGSGCLIELTQYGVEGEPVVAESLKAGISVVSFSGDKMLGGPQAGIIAGSGATIERVRKNPLMRALRAGKMTYSALEATLRIYERGSAASEVPVIRAIATPVDQLEGRAAAFAQAITSRCRLKTELMAGQSVIGGGSAPGTMLPTVLVSIVADDITASSIENALRHNSVPVIVRTERDRVLVDLRTVEPEEEEVIITALAGLSRRVDGDGRNVAGTQIA